MRVSFNAACILDDKLYISDNLANALMTIDMFTGEIKWISSFPNEKEGKIFLHKKAFIYNSKIIFVPNEGENLAIFDSNNEKIETISLPKSSNTRFVFNDSILNDNNLWIFPGNLEQPILMIDLETKEIHSYDSLRMHIENSDIREQKFFRVCKKGNYIYFALFERNRIVKFNIHSKEINIILLPIENIESIQTANDVLYLSTLNGEIYSLDDENNQIIYLQNKDNQCCAYTIVEGVDGQTLFVPNCGRQILIRHNGDNVIEKIDSLLLDEMLLELDGVHFEKYVLWNKAVVLFPTMGDDVYIIENNVYRKLKLQFEENTKQNYIKSREKIKIEFVYENRAYTLIDYFKSIKCQRN